MLFRSARYNRDCGCAAGGMFMVAAMLAVLIYLAVAAAFTIGFVSAGIAFIMISSLLGKAFGLTMASVRLELLRRSLSRRARRQQGERHVYVH